MHGIYYGAIFLILEKFILKNLKSWFKNQCIPRVVYIPFFIFKIFPIPFGVLNKSHKKLESNSSTSLCLEAGIHGWESIEFKELYQSACEYLGGDSVDKVIINRDTCYVTQIKKAILELQPTHYFYDPRTGSQKWYVGVWQAYRIAWLFHINGIIPVVLLTDLAIRSWRAQSGIVTAKRGCVISFVSSREVAPIFPHRRLISPSLMPLSEKTIEFLSDLFSQRPADPSRKAIFTGSLYEPRTKILNEIKNKLSKDGYCLDIKGREMGGVRVSDLDYWKNLSHSLIVVTTADQLNSKNADWCCIQHMIYRYLEVIASGSLLIAPDVPGLRRYFLADEHFVSFTTSEDAAQKIRYYLDNEDDRSRIAKQGKERAQALVAARTFWLAIDVCLQSDSLT